MKVLVLGGASYDEIIHIEVDSLEKTTYFAANSYQGMGSTGIGKAIPLFQLGFDVTFHYLIGKDSSGKLIKEEMKKFNFPQIQDFSEHTETHTNIMYPSGERTSIYTRVLGIVKHLSLQKIEEAIKVADVVFLNIIYYNKELIPFLKKYQKKVWVDLHDYDGINSYHQEFIDIANVLFLSIEALSQPDKWIERMRREKDFIVLTKGKDGAQYYDSSTSFHTPAESSTCVLDTNGAGDHFMVGFFYGYSLGYPVKECMSLGAYTAKLCIESEKIYTEKLSEDSLLSFLERNRA